MVAGPAEEEDEDVATTAAEANKVAAAEAELVDVTTALAWDEEEFPKTRGELDALLTTGAAVVEVERVVVVVAALAREEDLLVVFLLEEEAVLIALTAEDDLAEDEAAEDSVTSLCEADEWE